MFLIVENQSILLIQKTNESFIFAPFLLNQLTQQSYYERYRKN